jgi:hypothetical protein
LMHETGAIVQNIENKFINKRFFGIFRHLKYITEASLWVREVPSLAEVRTESYWALSFRRSDCSPTWFFYGWFNSSASDSKPSALQIRRSLSQRGHPLSLNHCTTKCIAACVLPTHTCTKVCWVKTAENIR